MFDFYRFISQLIGLGDTWEESQPAFACMFMQMLSCTMSAHHLHNDARLRSLRLVRDRDFTPLDGCLIVTPVSQTTLEHGKKRLPPSQQTSQEFSAMRYFVVELTSETALLRRL